MPVFTFNCSHFNTIFKLYVIYSFHHFPNKIKKRNIEKKFLSIQQTENTKVNLVVFNNSDIERLIVDMDNIKGDILVHPTHVIYVSGSPETTPGVIDNAISLDGVNQYVDLGQNIVCKGNLQNCPKGFTLRFKIKPDELLDNTYFFSSIPVDVFYQNNRLTAEARTPSNVWQVSTPSLNRNEWNQVDVSWHPVDGLVLYINGVRMDRQTSGQRLEGSYDTSKVFYIGRANTNMIREHYANADFDDVQLWEAKRDYLIPDLINPGEKGFFI